MRAALYNQMFGLDGNSFWRTLVGHWAVHYQPNPDKIWKRTDINRTIEIIKQAKADILGIVELLEGQEEQFKKELRKLGYKYFYFGKGHKTKYSNLHVTELIASKIQGKQIQIGKWPVKHCLGGGGGLAKIYFPKLKCDIILMHFGLPSKPFYREQIKFLQDLLKKSKQKTIILGDFNLSYDKIRDFFPGFNLVSNGIKTCSTAPVIKWFYCKDVDHILVKGLKKIKAGELDGKSDHKLVYADLKY